MMCIALRMCDGNIFMTIYILYLNTTNTPNSFEQEDLPPKDIQIKTKTYDYADVLKLFHVVLLHTSCSPL